MSERCESTNTEEFDRSSSKAVHWNKTKQQSLIDQVTTHLTRKEMVESKLARGVKISERKAFSKLESLLCWLYRTKRGAIYDNVFFIRK